MSKLILVCGSTGAGKTTYAIEQAKAIGAGLRSSLCH